MQRREQVSHILKMNFGFDEFRTGQREVIESVLDKRDTLAVMPTGSGKSICYQIPALYFGGVCLVISPLIALMQDQVRSLLKRKIPSGCLHSGLSHLERHRVMNAARNSRQFVLFVSPERLAQGAFVEYLETLQIKFVVVDEAHCIVEWGVDFRPEYQRLHLFKEKLNLPVLALTASATPKMRKEIARHLKLLRPNQLCFGFFRPNLFYQVQSCADFEAKMFITAHAVEKNTEGRILVYCATRLQCEAVARRLQTKFSGVDFYHAGLSSSQRFEIQAQMNSYQLKVLCCTCAFGMGIDYPDVRLVIHFEVPTSLEELYQETGRAGRDQHPALALTLYSDRDLQMKLSQVSLQGQKSFETAREKLRRLKCLNELIRYLRREACRHLMMSEYFGDKNSFQSLRNCGVCDFCSGTQDSLSFLQICDQSLRNRLRKLPQLRR